MAETSPMSSSAAAPDANWWRQAAVYQIYPRSFADANGDGIGDFSGVISRIPYLVELGVDAVWFNPFYPSALADGGYDVDDYRDVDPRIGTLADFDELTTALHRAGIKVIVDLVPNHTSDRHEWFVEALASPRGSAARGRYIFRDGIGERMTQPPSDWESLFGGSAWEAVDDGQYYLHLFAPEQPDLNWDDESVRADFESTIRFWADRGVDGFRVDVAHGLAKDVGGELLSQAQQLELWEGASHPFWDRDEVQDIYRGWRVIFDEYDPPLVGVAEAAVRDPARRARYAHPESLGQAFNFDLMEAGFDSVAFREVIARNLALAAASGSSSTWTLANHDGTRHPTRYGLRGGRVGGAEEGKRWLLDGGPAAELDRELGLRRARAASLLMLALPGSAYLYQGEELGLHEVADIPACARQDPAFFRNREKEVGRDGCRVPLPWTRSGTSGGGSSFGFGSGGAHLPQPDWFADDSVEAEDGNPSSTLALYRTALQWRRRLQSEERLEWVDSGSPDVLHFVRPGGWHSVTNFGDESVAAPNGRVVVASAPLVDSRLPASSTAWLVER